MPKPRIKPPLLPPLDLSSQGRRSVSGKAITSSTRVQENERQANRLAAGVKTKAEYERINGARTLSPTEVRRQYGPRKVKQLKCQAKINADGLRSDWPSMRQGGQT